MRQTVIRGGKVHGIQRMGIYGKDVKTITTKCGRMHDVKLVTLSDKPVDCDKCKRNK